MKAEGSFVYLLFAELIQSLLFFLSFIYSLYTHLFSHTHTVLQCINL